jgi:hypothetical protein
MSTPNLPSDDKLRIALLEDNYVTMAKYVLETMGKRITNIGIYIDAMVIISDTDKDTSSVIDKWYVGCKTMLYYCGIDQYDVIVRVMKMRLVRNYGSLDSSGGRWSSFISAAQKFWTEIGDLMESNSRTRINSKLIANIYAKKPIMELQLQEYMVDRCEKRVTAATATATATAAVTAAVTKLADIPYDQITLENLDAFLGR